MSNNAYRVMSWGGGFLTESIMKKITQVSAIVVIVLLGYMIATDAIGRWFGLWAWRPVLVVGFVAILPWLVFLAIDKDKLKKRMI